MGTCQCCRYSPFVLKEFNRDNNLIFEKNEDYWGEGPYLDGIEMILCLKATTAMAMLEAGQAHMWSGAQPQHQKNLKKRLCAPAWLGRYSVYDRPQYCQGRFTI